jgi:hypothetical protein
MEFNHEAVIAELDGIKFPPPRHKARTERIRRIKQMAPGPHDAFLALCTAAFIDLLDHSIRSSKASTRNRMRVRNRNTTNPFAFGILGSGKSNALASYLHSQNPGSTIPGLLGLDGSILPQLPKKEETDI